MKKIWECFFKSGKIIFQNPELLREQCKAWEGKKGCVTITLNKKAKSNSQNKYYWAVVVRVLSDFWGTTSEETHSALSLKFLRIVPETPWLPETIRSVSFKDGNWTTSEWETYMSLVRQWASSEFGVYIPEPNEIEIDKFTHYDF